MQKQLQAPNILQREDLKSFGSATGPCVSLFFPDHDPGEKTRQDEVRLRAALDGAESRLRDLGFDKGAIRELLDPVAALADDLAPWHMEGNAFAVFRSPDVFRVYRPMNRVPELAVVGEHFHILPIIHMLHAERHFFVLALAQKHIRLLRCTDHSSEEVPFPEGVSTDLEQWLNTRLPNSNEQNMPENQGPGATLGSFTSTTDRDRKDEFLLNFFRGIDNGIFEMLRNETAPLVLAGVENQVNLYTRANRYPHVAEDAVWGSPDSLKGGELHTRALPVAQEEWKKPLKKAMDLYEKVAENERRANGVDNCVRAAYQGRVGDLFVAEGASFPGMFNPDTLEVKLHTEPQLNSEDMVNLAALQTILHGGMVWLMPPTEVPGHNQVAAICRY